MCALNLFPLFLLHSVSQSEVVAACLADFSPLHHFKIQPLIHAVCFYCFYAFIIDSLTARCLWNQFLEANSYTSKDLVLLSGCEL